ncbi:MAG: hypothetical protein ABL931_05795 [Usitatibacteraceae bacterium]
MTRARSQALTLGDFLNAAQRTLEPYGALENSAVRTLGKSYLRQLRKLRMAARNNDRGQMRQRCYMLFKSPGAKTAAALLAYPKCRRPIDPEGHWQRPKISLADLKALAREVNMYHATDEPIRLTKLPKRAGGFRTIASFGRRSRAAQRLATDAMKAINGESTFEYARKGRGRDAFVQQILNSIQHRGVKYVGETDVEDFFPSVNQNAVLRSGLLPKAVLNAHVLMGRQKHAYSITPISRNSDRVGLWQGAIPSSYVASKIIEKELSSLTKRLGLIYVDNIAVGGATHDEAEVRLDTLARHLAEHPAGPFRLKYRRITRVGGDQDLLGYRVSKAAADYGGTARAQPSRAAICREHRKLLRVLMFADFETYEVATQEWARKWPSHYPLWRTRRVAHERAEIIAMTDVWPIARKARAYAKNARVTFGSFSELGKFSEVFMEFIQPEPDWGAIEADVINCGKATKNSVTGVRATTVSASSYREAIAAFQAGQEHRARPGRRMTQK